MTNLDAKQKERDELKQAFHDALKTDDPAVMAEAFTAFAESIQAGVIAEATNAAAAANDFAVMQSRGVRALTKAETDYYNKVIANEHGFDGVEELVPPTVFERVFEDLVNEHGLFKHLQIVSAKASTKWIVKVGDIPTAWWGKLSAHIKELLDEGFDTFDMDQFKLSAYIPVSKSMLELGPEWLDRYVRAVLAEAMAIGLERAIISGSGKEEPVGMLKDLDGAVIDGKYPDKEAVKITDLSPATFGQKIVAPLTKKGKRKVGKVLLVVNPLDYWNVIYPKTTILNTGGEYKYGVLPFPADVEQSCEVPKGKMVGGLPGRYFLGVASERKIEYSDEVRIIEDERVYVTKTLANGRPLDNESFIVFDISSMAPEGAYDGEDEYDLDAMTVAELKAFAESNGVDLAGKTIKADILEALREAGF